MPKSRKSKKEPAGAAAGTPRRRNSSNPKDPKQLAAEWVLKIKQDKEAEEKGEKALEEIIIPYFNNVQCEIASEDFSFGVSQLKGQKPVRVYFRLGRGLIAAISVTSEGIILLERSDLPKEDITAQIDLNDAAQTIENVTALISAFMERKI